MNLLSLRCSLYSWAFYTVSTSPYWILFYDFSYKSETLNINQLSQLVLNQVSSFKISYISMLLSLYMMTLERYFQVRCFSTCIKHVCLTRPLSCQSFLSSFEAGDRWLPAWAAGVNSLWTEAPKLLDNWQEATINTAVTSVVSDSVRLHPWDSPGKNTGVGCHFLLQCIKMESESEVTQSYPTLHDPMDSPHQAPLSMGFSKQEYWSGVPLPSPDRRLSPSQIKDKTPYISHSQS